MKVVDENNIRELFFLPMTIIFVNVIFTAPAGDTHTHGKQYRVVQKKYYWRQ